MCLHVREGWDIGHPYGYTARRYRHPNPVKATKGAADEFRLEPDGTRARTATQIAHGRYHDRLGYAAIADRLNANSTASTSASTSSAS